MVRTGPEALGRLATHIRNIIARLLLTQLEVKGIAYQANASLLDWHCSVHAIKLDDDFLLLRVGKIHVLRYVRPIGRNLVVQSQLPCGRGRPIAK